MAPTTSLTATPTTAPRVYAHTHARTQQGGNATQ